MTTATSTSRAGSANHHLLRRRFTLAGILLGLGLGGFVDGILLHQVLQWHHMLTDYGDHASFPDMTVQSLEDNTLWDGLFHLSTWVFVTGGIFVLWVVLSAGYRVAWRSLVGLLLAGWGVFNLVEGIVDHHILTVHHVRDDVSDPAWWDLGFLACGAAPWPSASPCGAAMTPLIGTTALDGGKADVPTARWRKPRGTRWACLQAQ